MRNICLCFNVSFCYIIHMVKSYNRLVKLREFLVKIKINPGSFVAAIFLSCLAAIFEGISVGVLIPMVKGILSMDFTFVQSMPILGMAVLFLSRFFVMSNISIFIFLISIIFISAVLKNIFQYTYVILISRQLRRGSNSMRKMIFDRYLTFGKMYFDQSNAGHLSNILINFTSFVTQQLKGAADLLTQVFLLIVYLTIMIMIDWRLSIIVITILPVLGFVMKILVNKLRETSKNYVVFYNDLGGKISNILSCMPLVKLYSREKEESRHFALVSKQIEDMEFSMDKKQYLVNPIQEITVLVAVVFLVGAMSFILANEKINRLAGFLVFFYVLRMFQRAFANVNLFKTFFATASGPVASILDILDGKDKFFIPEGTKNFSGLSKDIEFKHLNFNYKDERKILKDISFRIEKGKATAIVGPTGSGKTTIINLILRFYDCPPGSIFIDDIDIRAFTLSSIKKHMALVAQNTLLFNDTLKNNIAYGLDVSEAALLDAVKKARLYDFAMSLQDKLDTCIGDRGIRLSGGEKQRVAIARALLKGCEILILDEATSSLDTKTERLIQEAVDEAMKDRTAIVIAHRLSTIKNADKIIVIDDGRFIEEGSLNELLDRKGKFYEYWQEQKFY